MSGEVTTRLRPVAKADDPFDLVPNRREAEVRREIVAMLAQAVDAVPLATLERAITNRDVIDTIELDLDTDRLVELLASTVRNAGVASMRVTKADPPRRASIAGVFNLDDPAAIQWAKDNAAKLVVEITESTRQSIRDLITRAITEGGHPLVVARQIKPLIGLHTRWAQAVLNYRFGLVDQGVEATRVESMTSTYYNRLLTTRSRTIARTEVLSAANEGKYQGLVQAQSQGLLGEGATKVWIAADDAEENCADLDGTEVGLHEDFSSELGDVAHPPLHPNCRCTIAVGKGS